MKETYGSLLFLKGELNYEKTQPDEVRQRNSDAYVKA